MDQMRQRHWCALRHDRFALHEQRVSVGGMPAGRCTDVQNILSLSSVCPQSGQHLSAAAHSPQQSAVSLV